MSCASAFTGAFDDRARSVLPGSVRRNRGSREWYERRSPAAEIAFLRDLDEAVAAILDAPQRWTSFVDGTSRYVFRKFPYSLIYFVDDDVVVIVAVAHDKRQPGYWRGRLE